MKIVAKTSPLETLLEETADLRSLGSSTPKLNSINLSPIAESTQNNSSDQETKKGFDRLFGLLKKELGKIRRPPVRKHFYDKKTALQKYQRSANPQDQDNQKGLAFDIAAWSSTRDSAYLA